MLVKILAYKPIGYKMGWLLACVDYSFVDHIIPLINNLEIGEVFKDKNKKKGVGVIDFINKII